MIMEYTLWCHPAWLENPRAMSDVQIEHTTVQALYKISLYKKMRGWIL